MKPPKINTCRMGIPKSSTLRSKQKRKREVWNSIKTGHHHPDTLNLHETLKKECRSLENNERVSNGL